MTKTFMILIACLAFHIQTPISRADIADTEQKFHDLFVTAGYSTAFGAALGAAALGLSQNPSDKLSYIAVGASLGFIGGSIFGSYLAFSPLFADSNFEKDKQYLTASKNFHWGITPIWEPKNSGAGALGQIEFRF